MATTQNEHNGDGSDRRFSFTFPYIKEDDVKVSLRTSTADVTTIASTEYTFPSATEIQFNALSGAATTFQETTGAPKTGVTIRIFRDTDLETQRVTFFPGSSIRAQDLNDNTLQNLYASQERQSRAVDSTGGALTGNLTLNAADIVFEGDTADDFETTLTVVDPTADRTITLPNVTGTVITTGDTATITDALLAGSSVTTAKIAADAVDGTKIADNAIDSEHYVDGSIDRVHLAADIVDGTKIADNSIDSEHYVDGSIDTVHLASLIGTGIPSTNVRTPVISVNIKGQVTSIQSSDIAESDIASNAVTTDKIANDAVTAAKIAANAITEDGGELANDSVVTAKIKDLNVTTGKLAADAVTGAKIADDAVDSEHIAAGAVDLEHMSVNSVDSDQYVDGSIDTIHIGDQQITSGKLATNAVTTAKINADAITNAKIADNAVQKENINGLTAEISDLNQIDGKTLVTSATWTSDTQFPSANAIDARITARIDPIDGFVAIADEDSFPTTTPPEGTAVSISNAGGMVIGASASTTDASRAGGSDTVTIQNIPANMQSQTIQDGIGMIVIATSTAHTYDFHRVIATNADVIALSDDINDFNNRYRVGSTNPTTDNDEGDLFYNTGNDKMLVWDGSEWDEVQSIGEYFIIPDSDFPTWNGTLNDISITSNAPANAEQIILSINGVIQEPNSGTARPTDGFSLNGSTIQLSAAPATGSEAWGVIIGSTVNIGTPSAGTVTDTQVSASAAIAGTKIDPDFGSQDIVTTGNVGIGTTSPSNLLHISGSSAAQWIQFDGSESNLLIGQNTGTSHFGQTDATKLMANNASNPFVIGNNQAQPLILGTSSTERMRIDSSGRLLVGTTSALSTRTRSIDLVGIGTSTEQPAINIAHFAGTASSTTRPILNFYRTEGTQATPTANNSGDLLGEINFNAYDGNSTDSYVAGKIECFADAAHGVTDTPGRLVFSTTADSASSPTERMRIDSSGRVGIGIDSPFSVLDVRKADAGNEVFGIIAGNEGTSADSKVSISLTTGSDGTAGRIRGQIVSDSDGANNGYLAFNTRNGGSQGERLRIDSSGNVGIGTTSPSQLLELKGVNPQLIVNGTTTTDCGIELQNNNTSFAEIKLNTSSGLLDISETQTSGNITFSTGSSGTERARIDSSGRLLVGTSSASATSSGTWTKLEIRNDDTPCAFDIVRNDQTVGSDLSIGVIRIWNNDNSGYQECARIAAVSDGDYSNNDKPTRLVFSTTADGASSPTERMRIANDGRVRFFSSDEGIQSNVAGSVKNLFTCTNNSTSTTTGTLKFVVRADGDCENTNNSYGAISDIKLKENIVDASSQWNDLKALQVRNYNLKAETGHQTHRQIGLIAQEVELVSPGLVSESPDRDEDGNDLGTVTKSVNYSVLYMKAVKALQEAMERIETLETKVATLEGGE